MFSNSVNDPLAAGRFSEQLSKGGGVAGWAEGEG